MESCCGIQGEIIDNAFGCIHILIDNRRKKVIHRFKARQEIFSRNSSSVMVNASTRFSDGGEYGLGAEMGISTDKLHARGPMGQKELTCEKFIVFGSGEIRE